MGGSMKIVQSKSAQDEVTTKITAKEFLLSLAGMVDSKTTDGSENTKKTIAELLEQKYRRANS
jgi:hypothetical protein